MTRTREGEGQTALVTGASMGIGVDLAECFARDGYDLVLAARSEAALRAVAERLAAKHGVKATPVASDLSVPGAGATLAAAIAGAGIEIDVLVNNAGYGVAGAFDGSDRADQLCPGPTASNFRERAGTGKTRLSRNGGTPMPSAVVAEMGYRAWQANQRVVITGTRNRVLARLVPFLPRRTVLGLVHSLQSPL